MEQMNFDFSADGKYPGPVDENGFYEAEPGIYENVYEPGVWMVL